ncbi:unnamed protein product [Brassica oleracea]
MSLRQRAKSLEASLDLAKEQKEKYAQEIATRNKLLMDMVMQLSSERERIQKQARCSMCLILYSLAKENEKLRLNQCSEGSKYQRNGTDAGEKELPSSTEGGEIEAFAESLQAEPETNVEPEEHSECEKSSMNTEIRRASNLRHIPVFAAAFVLFLSFFALAFVKGKTISI